MIAMLVSIQSFKDNKRADKIQSWKGVFLQNEKKILIAPKLRLEVGFTYYILFITWNCCFLMIIGFCL